MLELLWFDLLGFAVNKFYNKQLLLHYNYFTALWLLSGTIQVSRHQKSKTKTNLDFLEQQTVSEWQWHQLGYMQICTSFQTDNHASTHHSVFYRPDALPAAQPNQQRRDSTEGNLYNKQIHNKSNQWS